MTPTAIWAVEDSATGATTALFGTEALAEETLDALGRPGHLRVVGRVLFGVDRLVLARHLGAP